MKVETLGSQGIKVHGITSENPSYYSKSLILLNF